jgi:hypothetical protein
VGTYNICTDFKAAYDSVFGIPCKLVNTVLDNNEKIDCQDYIQRELTNDFKIFNGLKKGEVCFKIINSLLLIDNRQWETYTRSSYSYCNVHTILIS